MAARRRRSRRGRARSRHPQASSQRPEERLPPPSSGATKPARCGPRRRSSSYRLLPPAGRAVPAAPNPDGGSALLTVGPGPAPLPSERGGALWAVGRFVSGGRRGAECSVAPPDGASPVLRTRDGTGSAAPFPGGTCCRRGPQRGSGLKTSARPHSTHGAESGREWRGASTSCARFECPRIFVCTSSRRQDGLRGA